MNDTPTKTNRTAKNAGVSGFPRHLNKLDKLAEKASAALGEPVTRSKIFQKVTDQLTLHDVIQLFTSNTKPQ